MKKTVTGAETNMEQWNILTEKEQVDEILEASKGRLQLVYKHSHTCGICHTAKEAIESSFDELKKHADMNFVNVKKSRDVSNAFAKKLNVRHESPQVLIIAEGECVWHKSHWSIKGDAVLETLKNL